jgi:hypothetical protein
MGRECGTCGRRERCVQSFGREVLWKESLERPRHKWEDDIKMDLQKVGRVGIDRIDLARDRDRWRAFVNAALNLGVP